MCQKNEKIIFKTFLKDQDSTTYIFLIFHIRNKSKRHILWKMIKLETYGTKGVGEKFRGYCDLVEIDGQIVLIIQKTIYDVPGTRNLVAENNLTFHYHFYCHFGKHIMNSKQPVNHIY